MAKKTRKPYPPPPKPPADEAFQSTDPAIRRELALLLEKASPDAPVRYARAEVNDQTQAVHDFMVQGVREKQLQRMMRARWPKMTKARVLRLMDRQREEWARIAGDEKVAARQAAIERHHQYRTKMLSNEKPPWSQILVAEKNLMDLEGTRAPIEINVSKNYTEAMFEIIGRLGDEEAAEYLQQAREMERLAGEARRLLPEAIIVEATPVDIVDAHVLDDDEKEKK